MAHDTETFVWEYRELSAVELAEACGFSEAEVRELVEYGALMPCDPGSEELRFAGDCVRRMRAAMRLREDLELELHAVALVISFLERIEELEARVRELSARLDGQL